jgi:[ribosomal protein S18]-alanine N-acetyltransferase
VSDGVSLAAVHVRPLTPPDADAIATWRYPGRYSTYDVREVVTPDRGVWAVEHDDELVGYCCFGPEARVPGVAEQGGTLDVGYAMRPDLVGRGLGRGFVEAILSFASAEFSPQRLRVLILRWNERSRKVAEACGFERRAIVPSGEGDFLVMIRPPF